MFIAFAVICGLPVGTLEMDCRATIEPSILPSLEVCENVLMSLDEHIDKGIDEGSLPLTAYILDARCLTVSKDV